MEKAAERHFKNDVSRLDIFVPTRQYVQSEIRDSHIFLQQFVLQK